MRNRLFIKLAAASVLSCSSPGSSTLNSLTSKIEEETLNERRLAPPMPRHRSVNFGKAASRTMNSPGGRPTADPLQTHTDEVKRVEEHHAIDLDTGRARPRR